MILECEHEWEKKTNEYGKFQMVCKKCGVDSFTKEYPVACNCKGCQEQREIIQKEREAFEKQLKHPFYQKVDDFRNEIKKEALLKAATKYKEPFNPLSWTIRELGKHAMSENYDQGNYIVGLMDAAEVLEKENKLLKKELQFAIDQANFWRARAKSDGEKWQQKETR